MAETIILKAKRLACLVAVPDELLAGDDSIRRFGDALNEAALRESEAMLARLFDPTGGDGNPLDAPPPPAA